MAYEVFARKWRPQQFDDVVGQDHVTRTLRNAVESRRIAHAYLFVGPRGTGKTSMARLFSKALNCEKGPTAKPCDRCDACREIAAGSSLDVIEIDGASNNSVEQVRDLREAVQYAPARGAYKVYIIDEVHMLSTSAFNALLKTLEEPPPHVKFLMATTEVQKVPSTILSRCQRFDLRRIPARLIAERLRLIASKENLQVSDEAIAAIARGADGGLRDAESALDQIVSFRGQAIGEEDVLAVFGLVSGRVLRDLAAAVLRADVPALLQAVAQMDEGGKDLSRLVVELLEHFRNVLICAVAPEAASLAELPETEAQAVRAAAEGTDAERLLRIVAILVETLQDMRQTLSRRTLLETALIRCTRAAVTVSLEQILAQVRELQGAVPVEPAAQPVAPAGAPHPPAPPLAVREGAPEPVRAAAPSHDETAELERLLAAWVGVQSKVTRLALNLRPALADTRPLRFEEGRLVVGVDREYPTHLKDLEVPRHRRALEQAVAEALGRAVPVAFEPADLAALPAAGGAPAAPAAAKAEAARPGEDKVRRGLREDPIVRKTLEAFDARIVEIRE